MSQLRLRRRLARHALFVIVAAAICAQGKAQAPGTTSSEPTGAQDYAERVNKQIDLAKELINRLPLPGEAEKAAAGVAGDLLKQQLDARAAAEKIMNHPEDALLPNMRSEASALAAGQITAKDREFIKRLSTANKKLCADKWLLCNGIPKDKGFVECSVGVPDQSLPAGRRNVGVLIIACSSSGQELMGSIVGVKALSLANYHADELGNCVTNDGLYWTYHGQPFAGFCSPCPDAILPNPFCPTGHSPGR